MSMNSSQASTISCSSPPSSHSWLRSCRPFYSCPSPEPQPLTVYPTLSREIITQIFDYTDYETTVACRSLCRYLADVFRRKSLEYVSLSYRPSKYGDRDQTRRLLSVLEHDPKVAQYIRNIVIEDSPVDHPHELVPEEFGAELSFDQDVVTALHNLCPLNFFHDQSIRRILQMTTNLQSLSISFVSYKLDWAQYEDFHALRVATQLLPVQNLTSLKLCGIRNFSLSEVTKMENLKILSLSSSQLKPPNLIEPSKEAKAASNNLGETRAVYLQELSLKGLFDTENGLAHQLYSGSLLSVEKLRVLQMDIATLEDVSTAAAIMDICGECLEVLEFSTRDLGLRKDFETLKTSFAPLNLYKLKNIRSLSLRLHFRTFAEVDELDWFLENMEAFHDNNALEKLKIIIDMAHHGEYDGLDRVELSEYKDWPRWNAIFLHEKFSKLRKMTVVVSSLSRDYREFEGIWLRASQCILLQDLHAKPGLELLREEKWDYSVKLRRLESSFCLGLSQS